MSSSQFHGKTFESKVIETRFGLTSVETDKIGPTEKFDIPFGTITCKHPEGTPVSIKTAAAKAALLSAIICLADARRVWEWTGPVILVVGLYSQLGANKHFHTVFEFFFELDELERKALYGSVTLQEVSEFHKGLTSFEKGRHVAARLWAKAHKANLTPKLGVISLNQKIDSKSQRRLQCSVKLASLNKACAHTKMYQENYGGLALPFVIESSSREFSSSKNL